MDKKDYGTEVTDGTAVTDWMAVTDGTNHRSDQPNG